MKQFISSLLIIVMLVFLFATNPSTEEFSSWCAEQSFSSLSSFPLSDWIEGAYAQYLEYSVDHTDYLFFSVYDYHDFLVLGVCHHFVPLGDLNTQIEDLRTDLNYWLDTNVH